MNVAVIGLGFVGLTTALGLCEKGNVVYGYDTDRSKVDYLRNKAVPFYEPDLKEALDKHFPDRFRISDKLSEAVKKSDLLFFCVGTPRREDGCVDLRYILRAIGQALSIIKDNDSYKVIVIKSTVPPSSTAEIILPYIEQEGFIVGESIGLVNNPEFLREGSAWDDFMHPDRIVLGVRDARSRVILEDLYRAFEAPVQTVSYNTAEFIKYLSNTLLSTLISFSNEMAVIADKFGDIDVARAFKILHQDKRWYGSPAKMTAYVYPGCGFGGYCLPKDTEAIYAQAKAKGFEPQGLKNVLLVNEKVKDFVADKLERELSKDSTIGILGLSFKPGSDDVRDTPALGIIQRLIERGFKKIVAYDPMAIESFRNSYELGIQYAKNLNEVAEMADCLVLLTAWDEFKERKTLLSSKKLYDFRYFIYGDALNKAEQGCSG
jgi:UDPglucose 6-dehydrogenase